MVIELRALGTRDFGHLWNFIVSPLQQNRRHLLHMTSWKREHNTLDNRLHPNFNTVCTACILARG